MINYSIEDRARVVATCFFGMQDKSEVTIGGVHSQNKLNEEFAAAFEWLVTEKFITKTAFGAHNPGRYIYKGTANLKNLKRASIDLISAHNLPLAVRNNPKD